MKTTNTADLRTEVGQVSAALFTAALDVAKVAGERFGSWLAAGATFLGRLVGGLVAAAVLLVLAAIAALLYLISELTFNAARRLDLRDHAAANEQASQPEIPVALPVETPALVETVSPAEVRVTDTVDVAGQQQAETALAAFAVATPTLGEEASGWRILATQQADVDEKAPAVEPQADQPSRYPPIVRDLLGVVAEVEAEAARERSQRHEVAAQVAAMDAPAFVAADSDAEATVPTTGDADDLFTLTVRKGGAYVGKRDFRRTTCPTPGEVYWTRHNGEWTPVRFVPTIAD